MKPQKSVVRRQQPESGGSGPAIHADAFLDRLLRSRGVTEPEELQYSLSDLPKPEKLRDIDVASDRIVHAIMTDQQIVIVGDYDCDGATSTALAVLALRAMGAARVDYLLPNRFVHGYGLSPQVVELSLALEPDLLITVDNGIASVDGVEVARQRGVDVVVTDHHLPPAKLPEAVALINPNIPGSTFPSPNIAGVGVIFFVLAAVRRLLAEKDWFQSRNLPEPKLADYLDLVAVGTVADVVPLDQVNRALVMQGIWRIRAGRTRPGILALLKTAGTRYQEMGTEAIGFGIGPRLNAAGRLDDMRAGVECLLAVTETEAESLAQSLERLNSERKRIGAEMADEAAELLRDVVARLPAQLSGHDEEVMSVCLYEKHWHEGVMGILAGRLKEQIGAPTIIFAATKGDASAGVRIKGSARSIPGYHILDALKRIRNRHPSILEKFGGHAMAAGLELAESDFATFRDALDEDVRQFFSNRKPPQVLVSDGSLPPHCFSVEKALELRDLAPWGQQFPAPLFDDFFRVLSVRVLKGRHIRVELQLLEVSTDESPVAAVKSTEFGEVVAGMPAVAAIFFSCLERGDDAPVQKGDIVHAVFELKANRFREHTSVQLQLQMLDVVIP